MGACASMLTPLVSCSEETAGYNIITDQDEGIKSLKIIKNIFDEDIVINYTIFDGWILSDVLVFIDGVYIEDLPFEKQGIIISHELIKSHESRIIVIVQAKENLKWYNVSFNTDKGVKTIATTQNEFEKDIIIKYSLFNYSSIKDVQIFADGESVEYSIDKEAMIITINHNLIPNHLSKIDVVITTNQYFENGYNVELSFVDPVCAEIEKNTIGDDIVIHYWVDQTPAYDVGVDVHVNKKDISWTCEDNKITISHNDLDSDDNIVVTFSNKVSGFYNLNILNRGYTIENITNEFKKDIIIELEIFDAAEDEQPIITVMNGDDFITNFIYEKCTLTVPYSSFSHLGPPNLFVSIIQPDQ